MVLVEASPGRPASVRRIPLSGGRRLIRLSGTLEELKAYVNDVGENILEANCDVETHMPDLADRVRELFPLAAIYNVQERSQTREVEVVEENKKSDVEPPMEELTVQSGPGPEGIGD